MIAYCRCSGSVRIEFATIDSAPREDRIELARGAYSAVALAVHATAARDGDDWLVPGAAQALEESTSAARCVIDQYGYALRRRIREIPQDAVARAATRLLEISQIHATSESVRFQVTESPRWIRLDRRSRSLLDWARCATHSMQASGFGPGDIDRIRTSILGSEDMLAEGSA